MAEAHSAVAFSFSVTPDGFNVHVRYFSLKNIVNIFFNFLFGSL